jgi:hypothetical protein
MRYADNFRSRPPESQWKWSKSAAEEEEEEAVEADGGGI